MAVIAVFVALQLFGSRAQMAQAERCAGITVGGLELGDHPELEAVFTLDASTPETAGRPHWSTAEGGHLYYYQGRGRWLLSKEFTPDKSNCIAWIKTTGEVPVGAAAWHSYDRKSGSGRVGPRKWEERMLTVTELPPEDLADE